MSDEIDALRQEVVQLRERLTRNEKLLDKTIGALALTSGAARSLRDIISQYYMPKAEGADYAAGMTIRGVFSAMEGAIQSVRNAIESPPNG